MSRRLALITTLVVVFGITGAAPASAASRWQAPPRYGINPPVTPPPWRVVIRPPYA